MIQEIKKKLKSQTGASISFALLLFLVCAIIGNIVLNAGTLSTSKIIDRAAMDKRYYEVTSAAEFLKDKFEGEDNVVEIERTRNKISENNYTYSFGCNRNGEDDLPALFAKALLKYTNNDVAMWNADFYHSSTFELMTLHFKSNDESITHEVNVTPEIKDGIITLDLKSTDGKYVLRMTLSPDFKEVLSKTGDIEKKQTTIKFIVSDIKKVF